MNDLTLAFALGGLVGIVIGLTVAKIGQTKKKESQAKA